ncbi:MAG: hypothetical protein D6763_05840 [Alphaproteobacteria bacterium]|nr:MAG: hypothetical protein D6763_05840 [Alphaproteobacteria bacterium]
MVGALLILHSAHLIWASVRRSIYRLEVYYFSIGDLLWFLASLVLLIVPGLITTSSGAIAALVVALLVANIGLAQLWTHAEANDTGLPPLVLEKRPEHPDYLPTDLSRLAALGKSWLGIKTWVKYWLFALNGAFLAAFFFWPADIAKIILIAYLATMPMLLAIMIVQRGLTRLLGIGHLIAWIPLVIYLTGRLLGRSFGSQLSLENDGALYIYVLVLLGFVTVCLAFDVYDLVKWFKGARSRLGSEAEMQRRHQIEAAP